MSSWQGFNLTNFVTDTVKQIQDTEAVGKGFEELVQTAKGGLGNFLGEKDDSESKSGVLGGLFGSTPTNEPATAIKDRKSIRTEDKLDDLLTQLSPGMPANTSSVSSNIKKSDVSTNKSDSEMGRNMAAKKQIPKSPFTKDPSDFFEKPPSLKPGSYPEKSRKTSTSKSSKKKFRRQQQRAKVKQRQKLAKQKKEEEQEKKNTFNQETLLEMSKAEPKVLKESSKPVKHSSRDEDPRDDALCIDSSGAEAITTATAKATRLQPNRDISKDTPESIKMAAPAELHDSKIDETPKVDNGELSTPEQKEQAGSVKLAKLLEEKETLVQRLISREQTLQKFSEEMGDLQHQISTTREQLQRRDNELRNLKEKLEASKKRENALLEKRKQESKKDEDYGALLEEAQELSKQVVERDQKLREMKNVVKRVEDDKAELRAFVQSKEKELQHLGNELEDKKKLIERNRLLSARNTELQNQLNESSKQIGSFDQDKKDLTNELKELGEIIIAKDSEITKLRETSALVENAKKEMLNNEEREEVLRKEIRKLRKKLETEDDDLREKDATWHDKLQKMKRAQEDLEKRLEDAGEAVSEATRPLLLQIEALSSAKRGRIEALEAGERSLRARLLQVVKELEEQRIKTDEAESRVEDLLIQEAKTSVQLKQHRQECSSLKRTLSQREQELSELSQEKEKLALDFSQGQGTIKELSQELNSTQKDLSEQVRHLRSLLSDEREHRQRSEAEREELHRQLLVRKEDRRMGNAYMNFESEIMLSRLSQTSHQTENRMSSSAKNSGVTGLVLNQLQQELRTKEGEIEGLRRKLDSMKETKQTLADRIVELKSENQTLLKHEQDVKNTRLRYKIATELISEKDVEIRFLKEEIETTKTLFRSSLASLQNVGATKG